MRNKFDGMSEKESFEYLEALQKEVRGASTEKLMEVQKDLRALNEHIEINQRTWAVNRVYEQQLEGRGAAQTPQGPLNPIGTFYSAPQESRTYTPGRGFNRIDGGNAEMKPDVYGSPEYRSAFFKTMLGRPLEETERRAYDAAMRTMAEEKRSDAFSTTTSAAAVVPTETLNEIVSKARTMGAMIGVCRGFSVPSNMAVPIGTPSSAAAWHVEGDTAESEAVNPSKVTFGGYELIKIFSMSLATKTMSISAFESYLIEELQNSILQAINVALLSGNGAGQGTGLLTGITWNSSNTVTYSDPGYTDLTAAIAMLKRGYGTDAKFLMNNAMLYNGVYSIQDANGNPIFKIDPQVDPVGRILGKEIVIDDNMPDNTIIYGNFRFMGYNMPSGIVMDVSRESSFKQGLIDYRAMAIADCKPLVSEAFVKIVKAA